MNLQDATINALMGINEAKGSNKTYTCIEDRQHGDFCVGETMTAEEWGKTAMGWADSDGWTNPDEPLLQNFKTEQDCINFIDDMWEITLVPSDSPEAKEFLGEARSHKEDNEKVAPRTGYEKEYMQNNANISWYDNSKFDIEAFKEPINAKRNKLNKPQNGKITHGSYEKSPNKQTQLHKDLKDLGYIKSNKKVTETIDVKAYTVTVSDGENQHSFQYYAEKEKTLDDVFNEIYDYVIF